MEVIYCLNRKYCNFNYSENGHLVYEDINGFKNEQTVLHLLHIKGLGRICIIICYDYLETQNRDRIIKNLRPTLICSPSFRLEALILEFCLKHTDQS